jgi:hypothetical protein
VAGRVLTVSYASRLKGSASWISRSGEEEEVQPDLVTKIVVADRPEALDPGGAKYSGGLVAGFGANGKWW